jgi:predicted transcriptional regulator
VAKKAVKREAEERQRAITVKMGAEIRTELDVLAKSRKETLQELALEAIQDLLKKYGRPANLLDALKKSARKQPLTQGEPAKRRAPAARRR